MAQGYNARLDDSLGAKHGKKSQSLKSRRHESEAMSKNMVTSMVETIQWDTKREV